MTYDQMVDIVKSFKVSRPVFKLTPYHNGPDHKIISVDANVHAPIEMYRPQPNGDDVLHELICLNFRESFSPHDGFFTVEVDRMIEDIQCDLRGFVPKFLEQNLEMKNPKQSKLYRWYTRNIPHRTEFTTILLMLYKYMRSFCGLDLRARDTTHRNNMIALLEAIMEKYE